MNMFWLWIGVGLVLLAVEFFASGLLFFWAGIAALIVGVIAWTGVVESGFIQIVIFAVLSVGAIVGWRHRMRAPMRATTETVAVFSNNSYKGRIFTLDTDIRNGKGDLRVDDVDWHLAGPDLSKGSRILVLGSTGQTLNVEEIAG